MNLRASAILNLTLGLMLWFGMCSDFSWVGTIPDYAFPPAVGVVAVVSLRKGRRSKVPRAKRLHRLACMPSLLGGGGATLLCAVTLFSPLIMSTMFLVTEIAGEKCIQRVASPDGTHVANVYFRPVGAYAGGNGRTFIRVTKKWVPFIERDLFYRSFSSASKETQDYVQWLDDSTLLVTYEDGGEIVVGPVQFKTPEVLSVWDHLFSAPFEDSE